MTLPSRALGTAWLVTSSLASFQAAAEDVVPPEMPPDYTVPLTDADLRAITLEVMQHFPVLSSSPGIKYAEAHSIYFPEGDRAVPKRVGAQVLFYPHAETRGIKYALQVYCQRANPAGAWDCRDAETRRYVKLDSQDFEVRVNGDLDLASIQALVAATRALAALPVSGCSAIADTVVVIFPANDAYFVSWGKQDGESERNILARLREGGDPADPGDWTAELATELCDRS